MMVVARVRKGFSIVEVVVAVTIFTSLIVLFTGIWPTVAAAAVQSRQQFVASSLASSVAEQCIEAAAEGATVTPATGTVSLKSTHRGRTSTVDYHYEASVVPAGTALVEVGVAVSWTEGGETREVRHYVLLYQQP